MLKSVFEGKKYVCGINKFPARWKLMANMLKSSNVRNFEAEESVRRILNGAADPQQQELLTVHLRKTRSAAADGLQ
jgi:hypothetical protein